LHTMNMMRPAKTQTFSGITRALQFDIKNANMTFPSLMKSLLTRKKATKQPLKCA